MSHCVKATVVIENRLGLHARPAMALVDTANRFQADIKIVKDGVDEIINGKSIMNVMMLAATRGTKLHIEATGPDADKLIAAIQELVARKFDEE